MTDQAAAAERPGVLPMSGRVSPSNAQHRTDMNRSDLIEILAERFAPLPQRDAETAVRLILDMMTDALARGQRVEVRNFGRFVIKHRPARTGRNPRTGTSVAVPEKRTPHFKPGKALREAVDRAPEQT
jgi:integration host factor subunit beta